MSDERLDTKGRRVGMRQYNGQRFPIRNEAGLCPGLEAAIKTVVDELEALVVGVRAMGEGGLVGTEGVVNGLESIIRHAQDSITQWTGS